ncbi:bifunctional serine/threonine-protein kinase/ABC transporter substrate-binding protein [Streptomyces prasinopilosus]|uniref:Serine/threonine protein kinase n=1 Tax=Streptomyces prasinopilosus TaxID=67344 RepID=A0A1G6YMV6_9ACTN|nr:bifunctional serine/threonine-protein kinase/ABC transporter substrate-binding protein [Streptomyces prasinopilosus]SDD90997.1 Serine/threonine protein kinase [Streptomyces prasinopilosus]
MERLRSSDPSEIGGHRLVGRLGAGGMGVVYLARSPHGAWCALKVIRAEHADDPGFRARFRREAQLAARLSGRWTVPVLAADADARSPWLATGYVPGLPLADAVARHGPWRHAHLLPLAAALAEVLADVHAAGLVHRDVKPANVLLAVDGPRLIDFGIARAVGATALTAAGTVVGSPGYLSPEQARGRDVGPASDVFSLGCVLAHTATGRAVFGGGGVAAVLYRTVHEEPDLDGVPPELDRIVRQCLAKDPRARPGARRLSEFLGEFEPDGWLPEGLPALVAAQASRIVGLPVPEPTVVAGPGPGGEPAGPSSPTRRHLLTAGAALGVAAAAAGAWWRWPRDTPAGPGTPIRRPRYAVGLIGHRADTVLTSHERGALLAVDAHNRDARRAFDLVLRTADDGGTAEGSARAAVRLAAERDTAMLIAAGTNATVPETVQACVRARITLLITRADTHRLNNPSTTTSLLLRSTSTVGPAAVLRYLNRVVKPARTVIVHDLTDAEESAETVRVATVYGKLDGETALEEVAADEEFTGVSRRIAERPEDAVLFAGLRPGRAASLARALRSARHRGACVTGEHVLGDRFLVEAEGWMVGTAWTDAEADPLTGAFAASYRRRHRHAPAPWAAEAYDAVRFAAHGLAATDGDGRYALRAELLRRPWQGITRRVAFDPDGHFFEANDDGGAFLYRVTGGSARFVARWDDIGGGTGGET